MQLDSTSPPAFSAPARGEGALGPYLRAIRGHRLLVVLVTLATLLASGAWLYLRSPVYEATTEVLVSPLTEDDPSLIGLPVIRDTLGEPTRAMQTAATLLEAPEAGRVAAERIGEGWTGKEVLKAIEVEPQGQSDILAVTGAASSADLAAKVTNEFSRAALETRAEGLRAGIEAALERLRATQAELPDETSETATTTAEQIARLETILAQGDPTLALTETAEVPTAPVGAPPLAILVLALLGGLSLGAGAAVLRELLDRAIRDEGEVVELYPLPVLARIPTLGRRERKTDVDSPWYMPSAVREAFRSLVAQVAEGNPSSRAFMVTSATTADGKTTSAVNLAVSIVASGRSAVLLDFDLRKPDVGAKLGLSAGRPLRDLLDPGTSLADLVRSVPHVPHLSVLSAGTQSADAALVEVLHARLPELIGQARELADYVVVDTAPLGEVSDALRVLHAVDETLLVIRPGSTNRVGFQTMRDLLERTGHTPLGLLVIGGAPAASSSYYGYGAAQRELFRPAEPVR